MPPTTKPIRPKSASSNGVDDDVMTLAEAAAFLKVTEADVLQALREHGLPGQQVGATWRFTRTALHRWLSAAPDLQANKDAWRAVAGKYADDEDLTRIREEISHQRATGND